MSRLTEERDRLTRQIQELEQNLGTAPGDLDLLSSDTSSGDGSDDELEQAEPSHQASPGLLAQRDQIQQEIEELQTALVSLNADDLIGDDSSDSGESDGELDIAESEEGCLQVNLVYQQVLLDSLNQLEQLLHQNARAQKELLFQMAGPSKDISRVRLPNISYQQPAKMYLGRFLKPYFKDKLTGLGPPANMETKDRINKMNTPLDDKRLQMKRWEGWQKTLLINSVYKDCLKRQIQPKLSKIDYLSQKMCSAGAEDKEVLREQIALLEKDIELLRSQKEDELVGDRYDEHDWQKISNIDFEGTREAEDLCCFWRNFLHPSVNKSSWTPKEIEHLKELSEEHGERDWESVAEKLGTGRTAFMCLQTYQKHVSKTLKKSSWSAEEDAQLKELVEKMRIGNFIPYTQMSYFMEGRDPSQLMYRWAHVLQPNLRKGHWSKDEDQALRQAVARLGEGHWCKIRLEVPGRSDSACRDRYIDCLKTEMKKGAFDRQERDLLVQLVKKHGVGRWSRIAAEIPNRFDAQCLREWRKFVRNKDRRNIVKIKTRAIKPVKESSEEEDEEVEVEGEEDDDEGQVVYMDSDDEKMKDIVKEEKKLDRLEEEREQKKEQEEEEEEEEECEEEETAKQKEVKPVEAQPGTEGPSLSYQVVERPSFGPLQQRELAVRSTLADASGRLLDTLTCAGPRLLRRGSRHRPLAMLQVSAPELHRFLMARSACAHRGRAAQRGRRPSRADNVSTGYLLMAAVAPWIGNLLVPDPTWDLEKGALALRRSAEAVSLSSTPVFRLLLQVLNVDSLGCKNIIEQQRQKALQPSPLRLTTSSSSSSRKPRPGTVQDLLQQRHKWAQGQEQLKCQLIRPRLMQVLPPQPLLLRTNARPPPSMYTRPVVPPQMVPLRLPHPTLFVLPPPAHVNTAGSHGTASLPCRPLPSPSLPSSAAVLQPADPADVVRGVKRERAKETSPSPGTPANRSRGAGESLDPPVKRMRRITAKAKALEEAVQAKNEAKCKTSQKKTPNQIWPAGPLALPSGHSMLIMTDGLVSLVGEPPPGLKIALPPRHRGPTPPTNVFVQPVALCLPVLPTNCTVAPISVSPAIQLPSVSSAIQLPSVSPAIQLPTVSPAIQLPTVSPAIQPPTVSPAIQPPTVSPAIQLPTVSPAIQLPTVSPAIQLPTVSPAIQLPTVSPDIQPPSVSIAQPPSVSPAIQPPSVSPAIQPPSVSPAIQPPSVSPAIQPPSVSPFFQHPFFSHAVRPPSPSLSAPMPCMSRVGAAPPPPLRREALQLDSTLMFREPAGEVQRWLSGAGGVTVPGLGVALPYLPPFVSSLDTLHALLAAKEGLEETAFQLLTPGVTPDPGPDHEYCRGSCWEASHPSDPSANVAAVRRLVAKHCAANPAYQMLKARFLSCFTLPALLATFKPVREKEEALKITRQATGNATLLQDGKGAKSFPGIATHRPLETQDPSGQDTSEDTGQDE